MGKIGDFFRKKVKDEEQKLDKKYHGEYTRRELRQKAASSVLKKTILTGGIAVTCIAAGVAGLTLVDNDKDKGLDEGNKTTYESETPENKVKDDISNLVNKAINDLENSNENVSSKIDSISTREDALKFIKEMYVEEYNKTNGTEYSANDIEFKSSNENYVYDLDGVYVTHGATPNDVKNRLEKEDEYYEIKDDVKVYSSYLVDNGKKTHIESFAVGEKMIVDVVLGDEYKYGKEISYEDKNTLVTMNQVIVDGINLVIDLSNGRGETDITIRKNNLEKSVLKYQKEHIDKNIEKGEEVIGG